QAVRTPAPQQPPVAAPAGPIQQTSLSDDGRREPVVRASSPDSDPPAPWPPPLPPADGGSTPDQPSSPALEGGTTIPVGGSGMPEPDPPTPGTTISAVGEAVVKSSGTDQPDTATAPPVPSIPPITPHSV